MRRFCVNFWSCTYPVTASNEVELKARAQSLADERKVHVGYYEVIEGRSHLLGVAAPTPKAGTVLSLVD